LDKKMKSERPPGPYGLFRRRVLELEKLHRWAPLWDMSLMSILGDMSAVDADAYSALFYLHQIRKLDVFHRQVATLGESQYPPYYYLAQSLWAGLFEPHLKVRMEQADNVVSAMADTSDPEAKKTLGRYPQWFPFHAMVMDAMVEGVKEFAELRELGTPGNVVYSTLATLQLEPILRKLIQNNKKVQELAQELEQLSASGNLNPQANKDAADKLREFQKYIKALLRRYKADLKRAVDETKEAKEALSMMGKEPPSYKNIDPASYLKLVKAFKKRGLKRATSLLGKLTTKAHTLSKKSITGTFGQGRKYSLGSDPELCPAFDLCWLKIPALRTMFLRAWAAEELPQYTNYGLGGWHRGPIIIVVDESGSMEGAKLRVAKALFLATQRIASRAERPVVYIGFSTEATQAWDCDDLSQLADAMSSNLSGGTEFDPALRRIMAVKDATNNNKLGDKFLQADVIFMTDGMGSVRQNNLQRFLEWKKETRTRVFGVKIGDAADDVMNAFCDVVTVIERLSPSTAEKAFERAWVALQDEGEWK